jgi:hypothetical protein
VLMAEASGADLRLPVWLRNVVGMDPGAVYGVRQRKSEFDVGVVFATDGRFSVFDLRVLRDDRGFFRGELAEAAAGNDDEGEAEAAKP